MSLALVLAAFAANGAVNVGPAAFAQSSFVLAAAKPVAAPVPTEQTSPAEPVDRTVRVQGPSWVYRPHAGAVLEVAAMGGEIVEAPRLAHVAFSWKF